MTNRKTTKRAFLASVMALIICFSMLLGTTYAWFTDTVSASRNRIVSGNLDVELDYAVMEDGEIKEWLPVEEDTNLFNENALYEPGYTEVVRFRIRNVGTLAVKCRVGINLISETPGINVYGDEFYLSHYLTTGLVDVDEIDAIKAKTTDTTALRNAYLEYADVKFEDAFVVDSYGSELTLEPNNYAVGEGEDETEFEVVITMPTSVGNEANFKTDLTTDEWISDSNFTGGEGFTNQPEILFGLKLAATQWTYEEDDFDDQYDADAEYPSYDAEDLQADLNTANTTTILTENVNIAETLTLAAGSKSVLDGNGNILYSTVEDALALSAAQGTVKDLSIIGSGYGLGADDLAGNLTIDNYYAAQGEYALKIGTGNGRVLTVTNSTFDGNVEIGSGLSYTSKFTDCKFLAQGEAHQLVVGSKITFENCAFDVGFTVSAPADVTITFRNCTYNGVKLTNGNHASTGFLADDFAGSVQFPS